MSSLLSNQLSVICNFFVGVQIWVVALCSMASDSIHNDLKEAEARLIHPRSSAESNPEDTCWNGRIWKRGKTLLVVGVFVVPLLTTLFSRVWMRVESHRKISNSHDTKPITNA